MKYFYNFTDLRIPDEDLKKLCLTEIKKLLRTNGRSLKDYKSMPKPDFSTMDAMGNKFIVDQVNYDKGVMERLHTELTTKLTIEQKAVHDQIVSSVESGSGGFFFLYGYGGTDKTFIWNTLSAGLRSKGFIVLNIASSGIALLLLPGGRTTHSSLNIPIEINEASNCTIDKQDPKAFLFRKTKLIIWDEAPMMHRYYFEAFDRSMRDIMSYDGVDNTHKPFGGLTVVLGGDFRQILLVVRKGSREDILAATVNASKLWKYCKVLKLTNNMRLRGSPNVEEQHDIKQFAD